MGILAIFSTAFSFLTSPIGRIAGIGMIALAVYVAGEIRGRRVATDACKAAAARAQQAANTQDRVAQEGLSADQEVTIDFLQKQKEKSDATIADLQLQLNARPTNAPCLYGPDGKPATGGVRNDASGRAGNAQSPRAPLVLTPRGDPASQGRN